LNFLEQASYIKLNFLGLSKSWFMPGEQETQKEKRILSTGEQKLTP